MLYIDRPKSSFTFFIPYNREYSLAAATGHLIFNKGVKPVPQWKSRVPVISGMGCPSPPQGEGPVLLKAFNNITEALNNHFVVHILPEQFYF